MHTKALKQAVEYMNDIWSHIIQTWCFSICCLCWNGLEDYIPLIPKLILHVPGQGLKRPVVFIEDFWLVVNTESYSYFKIHLFKNSILCGQWLLSSQPIYQSREYYSTSVNVVIPLLASSLRFGLVVKDRFLDLYIPQKWIL